MRWSEIGDPRRSDSKESLAPASKGHIATWEKPEAYTTSTFIDTLEICPTTIGGETTNKEDRINTGCKCCFHLLYSDYKL